MSPTNLGTDIIVVIPSVLDRISGYNIANDLSFKATSEFSILPLQL
jgi:hypothetical protein